MSRQFKASLYYLMLDVRYPLTIFWIVLLAIVFVLITLQTIFAKDVVQVSFSLSVPIIVFASVIGFLTVKRSVPYIVRMGATRNCVFVTVFIYFFSLILFNSVVAFLINQLIAKILGKEIVQIIIATTESGSTPIHHLAQFLGDSPFYQIVVDSTLALLATAVMFFIGLVFYRFSLVGGFILLGTGFIMFMISAATGVFEKVVIYIFENYNLMLYLNFFILSIMIYLISYLLIKRIAV